MLKIRLGKKISNLKILQKKKTTIKTIRMNSIRKHFYRGWNCKTKNTTAKIILNYKKIELKRMETKFDKAKLNDDEIETKI